MIRRDSPALGLRLAFGVVILLHAVLAVAAFWLLPQGFPILHRRFALNALFPACVASGSIALGLALVFAPRWGFRFLPAVPALWAAAALGLLLVFPETGAAAARPIGLVALNLSALVAFTCRKYSLRECLPATLLGVGLGTAGAFAERPPPPTTQPSRQEPQALSAKPGEPIGRRLEIGRELTIDGATLGVTWRRREVSISIEPALTFDRTPPDGFWSIFTDKRGNARAPRSLTTSPGALDLWAADGTLRLSVRRMTSVVELDAWTLVDQPTYSHLNSYTTVKVSGHQRLALRFAGCPSAPIAVTHADYPTGAPARFAYVDAARRFHVVQAADAEKGPFTSLAEGSLAPGTPLVVDLIELSDAARTFARLQLSDFAAQLSTALSPTAGHGVSENAIQFGLESTDANSEAYLLFTLAASGVGRGWDSVGHRAGAYRNRLRLETFENTPPPASVEPAH